MDTQICKCSQCYTPSNKPPAERSEALQGCPPSTGGSSEMLAPEQQGRVERSDDSKPEPVDNLVRSSEKAVRADAQHFVVITDKKYLEEAKCAGLRGAIVTAEYALMHGATRCAIFAHTEISPALAVQRERAFPTNIKLAHGE